MENPMSYSAIGVKLLTIIQKNEPVNTEVFVKLKSRVTQQLAICISRTCLCYCKHIALLSLELNRILKSLCLY